MLYRLRRDIPYKKFYPVSPDAVCEYMKQNTMEKLAGSLRHDRVEVTIDAGVSEKAQQAIDRMLKIPQARARLDRRVRTELIEISREDPAPEALEQAAQAIRHSKVVAIPTETLYVLAADPFSLKAVSSVFHAKGRELHRALPILVDSVEMALEYSAQEPSDHFRSLTSSF